VANLHAKCEVSSFNSSRNMEESQNSKNRSRDTFMTPFGLILHFFAKTPTSGQCACQNCF